VIRKNKRFLTKETPIQINSKKITNFDRVLDTIKESDKLLTFTEIANNAKIRSTGNLSNILRILMQDKVVQRENGLYKLI